MLRIFCSLGFCPRASIAVARPRAQLTQQSVALNLYIRMNVGGRFFPSEFV